MTALVTGSQPFIDIVAGEDKIIKVTDPDEGFTTTGYTFNVKLIDKRGNLFAKSFAQAAEGRTDQYYVYIDSNLSNYLFSLTTKKGYLVVNLEKIVDDINKSSRHFEAPFEVRG